MIELNFDPFPNLSSSRLRLRPILMNDAAQVFKLRSDPQMAIYLQRPLMQSMTEARDYILKMQNGVQENQWILWVISTHDSYYMGSIGFWNIVPQEARAEIGYELLPEYHRKGIMQEVAALAIDYGFRQMGLQKIRAVLAKDNEPSIRLLQKKGFVQQENDVNQQENTVLYTLSNQL